MLPLFLFLLLFGVLGATKSVDSLLDKFRVRGRTRHARSGHGIIAHHNPGSQTGGGAGFLYFQAPFFVGDKCHTGMYGTGVIFVCS